MSKKKYWLGSPPIGCDICDQPFRGIMIDGRTKRGPWSLMCDACHEKHGASLGTGVGQQYEKQPDGRWLKIAG